MSLVLATFRNVVPLIMSRIISDGCCRFALRVVLLERSDDVTQGATKGNSGIVHAGYDDTPGSLRAKFCWKGNQVRDCA